jgi:uncharacterized protein (TIGR01777 family)
VLQKIRLLLSGSSGFIGHHLLVLLESYGYEVVALPRDGFANRSDYEGFDAVVHLAGEPLTLSRWSEAKKEKLFSSRVSSTQQLCHIFSNQLRPPKVFVSASAIGYYGDRGDEILMEKSSPGSGFLAHLCVEWERASQILELRGIRTAKVRFGPVIGPGGGMLAKMIVPYKLGLGATLGSGQQWVSWVSLEDVVYSIHHILYHSALSGPFNIVSPNPVRQIDFSKQLAHALHRPAFLRVPAWALKMALGQTADELLLASARVSARKLLASGFSFQSPNLQDALQKAIP